MAKVMIIEDEDFCREAYARLAKRKGCEAVEAADGLTAVELFKEHRPGLVFVDFHLPELTGEKVFEEIRKIDPGVKVYFLSGSVAKIEKMKSLKSAVNGYLLKPIDMQDIAKIIEEYKANL